ncbi:hypothetical protein SH528x_003655 [Novipirellula sp. SH528]|uniref:hypothetical protein n=1 Tax=Novipirellula sp. SH528 TaxID=3454466 RepID=UPI003F9FB88D
MNDTHSHAGSSRRLMRHARGLAVTTGLVCILMSLGVFAGGYDILNDRPVPARLGRASVLMLPVFGWIVKRTVLDTPNKQYVFVTVEHGLYAVLSGFIWWGTVKMRRFQNYRLSIFTAKLAIFPLVFTGFPFGLVFGYLALRTLRRPEIKAQFAANCETATP